MRSGARSCNRVAPWGIHIAYHDIFQSTEMEEKYPNLNYYEDVEQLFKIADILSIHIPLDETTRHFVGEHLLRLMRPRALLVNTARGGIIDFEALIRLLKNKEIAIHLAFDVYEEEPIRAPGPGAVPPGQRRAAGSAVHLHPAQRHGRRRHAGAHGRHDALQSQLPWCARPSVKDIKELNLIPPLAFVKKEPRMLDDYRIFRWWQGK